MNLGIYEQETVTENVFNIFQAAAKLNWTICSFLLKSAICII
jgi:hypothetical protein